MTTTMEPRTRLRTPAALLADRAGETPAKVALREKYHGVWREITWR